MPSTDRTAPPKLLHALALLLVTAAALLATALADDRAAPASERGSDPLAMAEVSLELLPQVARRVEAIRGLRFDELPLPRVVSADFLSARIEAEFRRREGEPREALAAGEAIARIVGLLDADEDLLGMVEGSGDLAAAAWDTQREHLYVVADAIAGSRSLAELFLAHELVHAIEDQRFGLPESGGRDGDRALATSALVEGTATALMLEYAQHHLDPLALGAAALGIDPGTDAVPAFAVEQLEWTYLGGARFVGRLYELGAGWTIVNHALEHRPPVSTAQVLHPIKYLRDERPLAVEIDATAPRQAGWQLEDAGTVGELATGQLLALGMPRSAAGEAAAGWAGDRYELWQRGAPARECAHPCRDELVLIVRWRWDSAADRRQFARAARRYVVHGLDGERTGPDVWALDGGWAALAADRRATTLAFAPDEGLARSAASGRR